MVNNMVEVRDLVVERGGRRVLHGLGLTIEQGSVTGLLGPSGCGKSTLMRALVGVQMLTSGRVTIDGVEAGGRALRSRVGYVTPAARGDDDLTAPEKPTLFPPLPRASPDSLDHPIEGGDLTHHPDPV